MNAFIPNKDLLRTWTAAEVRLASLDAIVGRYAIPSTLLYAEST